MTDTTRDLIQQLAGLARRNHYHEAIHNALVHLKKLEDSND